MAALNHNTGEVISGWAEVEQSLNTILETHIGERVRRRLFGVRETALLDKPQTSKEFVDAYIAICEAISPRLINGHQYGEPRFELSRIVPTSVSPSGAVSLELGGIYFPLALLGDFSVFEVANTHFVV